MATPENMTEDIAATTGDGGAPVEGATTPDLRPPAAIGRRGGWDASSLGPPISRLPISLTPPTESLPPAGSRLDLGPPDGGGAGGSGRGGGDNGDPGDPDDPGGEFQDDDFLNAHTMDQGEREQFEAPTGPEWEISPERGRWLFEEIYRLRTTMTYNERYALRDENGELYLPRLYKEVEQHVKAVCRVRNEKDPWDRYVRAADTVDPNTKKKIKGRIIGVKGIHETPLQVEYDEAGKPLRLIKASQEGEGSETASSFKAVSKEERDNLTDPLDVLIAADENRTLNPEQRKEVQRQLLIHFRLAHEKGLLQGADQALGSIARDLKGIPANQTRRLIRQRIEEAEEAAILTFDIKSTDPDVVSLYQIWNPYIRWARQRMELSLQEGQRQPEYREGEFKLPEGQGADKETYWEIGSYPKYYHITARTEEQFLIAKETFLRMIKDGSLGKSPQAIYEHVENFKSAFGGEGGRQNIRKDFLTEQRQELEGQLLVFVADYASDTYNPKTFKDASTSMALDEGPARWTRLLRAGGGQVGSFTFMFDKEALMEIFTNPVGERGELKAVAQHFMQEQARQIAIERGLGILLKDYDPDEPNNPARFLSDENAQAVRQNDLRANQERIGLHMSDEEFKNLYEGFEKGGDHIENFLKYGVLTKSRLKDLPDDLKDFVRQNGVQRLNPEQRQRLPKRLKDSIELGRIQLELQSIREKIRSGELKLERRDQTAVDFLNSKDRNTYNDFYASAETNFNIAFQMQGATGEKVRRGKGFFYVDKNPHFRAFSELEEKSVKIAWILEELKQGQEEEEEDKAKGGGRKIPLVPRFSRFSKEVQDFWNSLSDEEKKPSLGGLYGIDKNKMPEEQIRSLRIGWMLNEMKNRRRLNSFDQDDIKFYNEEVRAEEKDTHVDHIPVYLAEALTQYVVNHTKIQHANAKPEIRKVKNAKTGKEEDVEVPGAQVRFEVAEKARKEAIKEIVTKGWQAKIKLPKILFNTDPNSPKFGEVTGVSDTEFEEIDYQTAVKSIYSRYTTHTYWGYQPENSHMLLNHKIFEAAKRIRAGLSRPEDEDILATQLLIVDPTLKRLIINDETAQEKEFENDERTKEVTLLQSAVEESFLSHVYIVKDLYKSFLPQTGNAGKMRTGYNWEDWGGMMRFTMGIRELAASQPTRFARRLAAGISFAPMFIDSMPAIWGAGGVLGAVSMFSDKIKDKAQQGIVSQFGITKFIDQIDGANGLYAALIGTVHEGKHVEGWWMKPTNNNEFQHKWGGLEDDIDTLPKTQLEFLKDLRESFGRLETVIKLMRPLYSDTRNAGGALRLEKVDIFLENGRFNPDIEKDSRIYMNTGTSRHLESDFYDEAVAWILRDEPGGGGHAYPEELLWNRYILKKMKIFVGPQAKADSAKTFKSWFFDKAGL